MAKSKLPGEVKRLISLEKQKGHLTYNDLSPSPLSEKVSSEKLETLLGTVDEMHVEIAEPAEQTVPQQEGGKQNRKSDEANVDLEDGLQDAEQDSPVQQADLSPIDDTVWLIYELYRVHVRSVPEVPRHPEQACLLLNPLLQPNLELSQCHRLEVLGV